MTMTIAGFEPDTEQEFLILCGLKLEQERLEGQLEVVQAYFEQVDRIEASGGEHNYIITAAGARTTSEHIKDQIVKVKVLMQAIEDARFGEAN